MLVYLPLTLWLKNPLLGVPGERFYLIQRSFFGFITITFNYYSMSFISLSDASAIAFSSPVFVSIFAYFLLKEKFGVFQVTTVFWTLTGVVLIARPSFLFGARAIDRQFSASDRLIGTSLAFVASLCMALAHIMMRRLQKTPTTTVISFFSMFCAVCGLVVVSVLKLTTSCPIRFPAKSDYVFIFANGMSGVLGQGFIVVALKIEEAGLVTLCRTFDIVIAFLYQITFLNQEILLMSVVGAVVVSSGCVACGLKKYFDAKPETMKAIVATFSRRKDVVRSQLILRTMQTVPTDLKGVNHGDLF